jgi:hypothetical protein
MKKLYTLLIPILLWSTNVKAETLILKCKGEYATRYAVIDLKKRLLGWEKTMPTVLDWEVTSSSEFEITAEKLFVREYTDGHIYKSARIITINRVSGEVTNDRRVENINKDPNAEYNPFGIPVLVIPDVTCEPFSGKAKF